MGHDIFHDSTDLIVIGTTNRGRKFIYAGARELEPYDGDEKTFTHEEVEAFGLREYDLSFSDLGKDVADLMERQTENEDEEGEEEVIVTVTLYQLRQVRNEEEYEDDEDDEDVRYRVSKMLVYYSPFIVD
jgi:hypothetical protein